MRHLSMAKEAQADQDPCQVKYMVETVEGYIYHLKTNSNREPDYKYFLIEYNKVRSSLGMPKACALDQVEMNGLTISAMQVGKIAIKLAKHR